MAVMFENDKDGNEKRPDFSGPMQNNDNLKVSGWRREKDGKPYISLSVGDKQGAAPSSKAPCQMTVFRFKMKVFF